MKQFKLWNNLAGWLVFIISASLYIYTAEPTASLWDCGEYIATALKLQVGHPPGAPFFQLTGRIFGFLADPSNGEAARMINYMSALSSAFTILFLFWSISLLLRKLIEPKNNTQSIIILLASFIGSMSYSFTDSFWFSAVEGEVYAMSSLFTAAVFWAILKWDEACDADIFADRWLILITYLVGLSIGVHLLNLLAIPAITMVYYARKEKRQSTLKFILYLIASFVIVSLILFGIIPFTVKFFAATEILFINQLGLPFNTGSLIALIVLISLLSSAILYSISEKKQYLYMLIGCVSFLGLMLLTSATSLLSAIIILSFFSGLIFVINKYQKKRREINMISLGLTFLMIGYSSFMILVIRANAGTPINEGEPSNAPALLSYLNRDQYGDWPLLKGPYYDAEMIKLDQKPPLYRKNKAKGLYEKFNSVFGRSPVYEENRMTIFPRMYSQEDKHINDYKAWTGKSPKDHTSPTFKDNLTYFFSYQIDHMYFRYFMWNFSGRQDDIQGTSNRANGNWITGISFLDKTRVGDLSTAPKTLDNKARNSYYLLPLLFGLIGLIYHFRKHKNGAWQVFLLFFMTGLAIAIYLNQTSPQPRERDYAYAASFYAFAIWIGVGTLAILKTLSDYLKPLLGLTIGGLFTLSVPLLLFSQNYDDHDRSGRYDAVNQAKSYLDACPKNAILFTAGDNDTFPLWYVQEVEGYRTDVRVCNLSLFNSDWYIRQMTKKQYQSEPLPVKLPLAMYNDGNLDMIYLMDSGDSTSVIDLQALYAHLSKSPESFKTSTEQGLLDVFPGNTFWLRTDPKQNYPKEILPSDTSIVSPNGVIFRIEGGGIGKSDLALLDILAHNNWERPICFTNNNASPVSIALSPYLRNDGLIYTLSPLPGKSLVEGNQINTKRLTELIKGEHIPNMSNPSLYYNEDYRRNASSLRIIHSQLAFELAAEGKNKEAGEIIQLALERYPRSTIPSDLSLLYLIESGMAAKQFDLINPLLTDVANDYADKAEWYANQPEKVLKKQESNFRQAIAVLHHLSDLAYNYDQIEIGGKIKTMSEDIYSDYLKKIGAAKSK